jgi:restriction-modification enzyme MmeI-like protein
MVIEDEASDRDPTRARDKQPECGSCCWRPEVEETSNRFSRWPAVHVSPRQDLLPTLSEFSPTCTSRFSHQELAPSGRVWLSPLVRAAGSRWRIRSRLLDLYSRQTALGSLPAQGPDLRRCLSGPSTIGESWWENLIYRVLDPACGSGNFLYVAYREMRRLEHDVHTLIAERRRSGVSEQRSFNYVTPDHFYGIDVNPFAVEMAKVTMMLGKKLAADELGDTEPLSHSQ